MGWERSHHSTWVEWSRERWSLLQSRSIQDQTMERLRLTLLWNHPSSGSWVLRYLRLEDGSACLSYWTLCQYCITVKETFYLFLLLLFYSILYSEDKNTDAISDEVTVELECCCVLAWPRSIDLEGERLLEENVSTSGWEWIGVVHHTWRTEEGCWMPSLHILHNPCDSPSSFSLASSWVSSW